MTAEKWSARLRADVLHLMEPDAKAGLVKETAEGLRVAEYLVVVTASGDRSRMHVVITKNGVPDESASYAAGLDEDPLTIAYAVATRLGFATDAIKRDAPQ